MLGFWLFGDAFDACLCNLLRLLLFLLDSTVGVIDVREFLVLLIGIYCYLD